MNNIAASLGLSQLKKLDRINSNKTNLIKKYLHTVNDLSYAQPLLPYSLIENNTSSYWLFGLRCDNRDSLMDYLDSKSVSVGMHFTPINEQPLYSDSANKTPITSEISKKLITLPLSPAHSSEEIDYVCDLLKSYELNY